jgi:UrcA family protein
MKNVSKIQSKISKFIIVAASCFGFGCIVIGGEALAQQPTAADTMKVSLKGLSFATVSSADDGTTLPHVIVKFGDLDVSNPQGASLLYDRIQTAARNVCSRFVDPWNLVAMANRKECVDKTILDTVTKINSSALTAVYSAKTGKKVPTRLASGSK